MEQEPAPRPSRRILEPIDRITEVLFGLIMVLTFTGSLSAAEAGRQEVRAMLIGALGCNLAWGIIDAILYLMESFSERARNLRSWRQAREAADPEEARRAIAGALPPLVASLLEPPDLEKLRLKLTRMTEPPSRRPLKKDDFLAALAVFLWVFLTTFPVAIPFLFFRDPLIALRASNAVAVTLLFLTGYAFGRLSGSRPWLTGLGMVLLGLVLVGITIALGG